MNVFVGVCSARPEFTSIMSMLRIMDFADGHGITCRLYPRLDESLICRARQRTLADFMDGNDEYLFTMDDDLLLDDDAIYKLVKADKDIIGGFYRLKNPEIMHPAVRLPVEGHEWYEIINHELIAPALYMSTGCMLVKRHVIEGMIKAYPELEYEENLTGSKLWALYMPMVVTSHSHDPERNVSGYFKEYLSEDWAFCQRALDAGYKVWCHGGVVGRHWGKFLYMLNAEKKNG